MSTQKASEFCRTFEMMQNLMHDNAQSKGFWEDYDDAMRSLKTGPTKRAVQDAFISQKLQLISDEVTEAHEALRDGNPPSEKAQGSSCMEEELADVVIRIMDLAGKMKWDVAGAIEKKARKNATRPPKHGRRF